MEINDLRRGRAEADEQVYFWDSIDDINSTEDYAAVAASFLNQNEFDKEQMAEVLQVVSVYQGIFHSWKDIILGRPATSSDFEDVVLGESVFLETTNKFYRSIKPVLSVIITDIKLSMAVSGAIDDMKNRANKDTLSGEAEVMWMNFCKIYDLVPWVIFLATGDSKSLLSGKVFMSKVALSHKDNFIAEYKARGNNA